MATFTALAKIKSGEIFMQYKSARFGENFSRETFPLYGTLYVHVQYIQDIHFLCTCIYRVTGMVFVLLPPSPLYSVMHCAYLLWGVLHVHV